MGSGSCSVYGSFTTVPPGTAAARAAAPSTCSLNGSSSAGSREPERAAEVAVVHALQDARQLPVGERDVERQLRDVAAADRVHTGRPDRRGRGSPSAVVAEPVHADASSSGPGPVHLQQTEVGQRVAERADLPVEHGTDRRRRRRRCSCRGGSRRARSWPGPARGCAATGRRGRGRRPATSRVFWSFHWPYQRFSWRAM